MKQRFSSLDVRVIASELSAALVSLRISNIYDLSSRIFLFKLAKPGKREQLLVDSGFRCHLTSFTRTAASAPSAFVSRLRKYLKSRRVTGVSQIGTDRVIEITFSDGQYRLFLEFFAAGNIVLTDSELNVLALLRQVNEGDANVDVRLGSTYVVEAKQNFHGIPPLSQERIKNSLEQAIERSKAAGEVGGKKAKRAKGSDDLRKALGNGFPEFPAHLLDHAFLQAGINMQQKAEEVLSREENLAKVMVALEKANEVFRSLNGGESKGYIIAKEKTTSVEDKPIEDAQTQTRDTLLYDDFHPFRPSQFENKPGIHILEFDGFNKTVDEFYSSIESQRLESRLTEREEAAKKKLDTAKSEHEKRLGALQQVQEMHIRKAQSIEANTHRVEEACAAVNGLIGQGMDWVDIGKLIENEQSRDNVVAQMIKLPLKLEENTVTLLLDEPGAEDESESEDDRDETDDEADSDDQHKNIVSKVAEKRLAIDIDLALSPWANARQYYDQKKSAAVKEQKTLQASARALKSTEKKIETDLKKGLKQEKAALRPSRKQFWFEKFLCFISSDGYLVIGGKDAQQNELLYRRYLKKGDIYVHADLQGASSVVIKNNPKTPDAPIPPSTLAQAGALTVCTSSAWDSKAVMGAWWVNADQVSKTAPTGEYLVTGGFMIRGKKNFLPPIQLLLGFAVMWLISEESRANHGKHRLTKTESMLDGEAEALANDLHGISVEEDPHTTETESAVVPDIEDAAEASLEEVDEDNLAVDGDDEDKESVSSADPDIDADRSNPLQASGNETSRSEVEDDQNTPDDPSTLHANAESESNEEEAEDSHQPTGTSTPSTTHGISNKPTVSKSNAQLARGKRSKAKKAAKKYAEQDEEDRILAMEILGSAKGQEKKELIEQERAAREAKLEADKERRRAQHAKNAERERLRQERLERGEEGDANDGDEAVDAEQLELERKELADIDLLVPQPEPGDELIAAIPVVAPWGALGRCKYKVKLQPGGMKKGKALKEIVGVWTSLSSRGAKIVYETNSDKERPWSREIELLKAWRVEEIVGVLPVKGVRIVQGGGFAGKASASSSGGGKGKAGGNARGGSGKGGKKGR